MHKELSPLMVKVKGDALPLGIGECKLAHVVTPWYGQAAGRIQNLSVRGGKSGNSIFDCSIVS